MSASPAVVAIRFRRPSLSFGMLSRPWDCPLPLTNSETEESLVDKQVLETLQCVVLCAPSLCFEACTVVFEQHGSCAVFPVLGSAELRVGILVGSEDLSEFTVPLVIICVARFGGSCWRATISVGLGGSAADGSISSDARSFSGALRGNGRA